MVTMQGIPGLRNINAHTGRYRIKVIVHNRGET